MELLSCPYNQVLLFSILPTAEVGGRNKGRVVDFHGFPGHWMGEGCKPSLKLQVFFGCKPEYIAISDATFQGQTTP